ncbi:hypothetical protein HMPREF1624_00591 [Sporothrix schenckii ATCC 58251]|uniref:Uncharacterized protein n=1 Tax=Sporothrix schenckii (strain ATCC 58251 / de Perez 2211183) TaxID=1391915 RepID=U7Q355_SPOS1|nr:hypothetical protein HMPREF1624_00591 [Sporothrix schenckii ATCC 58251]
MDVTAMLNTASTAAALEPNLEMIHERKDSSDDDFTDSAQTPSATTGDSTAPSSVVATPLEKTPSRRSSDSRAPNRNRTPWDAGGYSLSMALDNTKKLVQTSPNTLHVLPSSMASTTLPESIDTASTAVPGGSTSPRHKFSDSRSSLSSAYTNASSTNSVTHSRISSLSTVSENQPLSNLIADFSLLETRISEPCIGGIPASIVPCQGLQYQQHQHQLKLQQYSLTATQLPPSHERAGGEADRLNFQPESPTPVRSQHDMSMGGSPGPSPRSPGRAQSPSDAMLIQRSGQPEETDYFQSPSR